MRHLKKNAADNVNVSQPSSSSESTISTDLSSSDTYKFLAEQNEAYRKALREDAEGNRKALLGTIKIVAYPVSLALLVVTVAVTFLGWRSWSDFTSTLESAAKSEISQTIKDTEKEINSRLDEKFQTPEITAVVAQTAREQTQTALLPLIKNEVSSSVQTSVDALKPTIASAVNDRVESITDDAVKRQLETQIQPLLQTLQKEVDVTSLIMKAQSGDGASFDKLIEDTTLIEIGPDLRNTISLALENIVDVHNSTFRMIRTFKTPPSTDEQWIAFLSSPNWVERQITLDTMPQELARSHIKDIFQIMIHDSALAVRDSGFIRFNQVTGQNFVHLDSEGAENWWSTNAQLYTTPPPGK